MIRFFLGFFAAYFLLGLILEIGKYLYEKERKIKWKSPIDDK